MAASVASPRPPDAAAGASGFAWGKMDEQRQKELMQLLREELKYSMKEEMYARAEESCLQVDLTIQRVLRRLPPQFRNMPSTEAFRLGAMEHVAEVFQYPSNEDEGVRARNVSKEASSRRQPDTARSTKASSIGSATTAASPPGSGVLNSSPGCQTITRGSIDGARLSKNERPASQPVEALKSLKALKAVLSTKEADALPPKVADEAAENVQKGEAIVRLQTEIQSVTSMLDSGEDLSKEHRHSLLKKVETMYKEIYKVENGASAAECSPCAG